MWSWLGITDEPKDLKDEPVEDAADTEEKIVDQSKENATDIVNGDERDQNLNLKDTAHQFGNFLYNVASVATKTASKTASKLKETVDGQLEKSIVGEFQRENERFVQERESQRIGDAVPPWVGFHEEDSMKKQILSLSKDERNFLRNPPTGVDYIFDMEQIMPVAKVVLREDEGLQKMRFKLVPKKVAEDRFWRNYFYRVSLIKQSTQLSTLADLDIKSTSSSSSTENLSVKDDKHNSEEDEDDFLLANEPGCDDNTDFASDALFATEEEGLSEEERMQMGMAEASMETYEGKETKKTLITVDYSEKELEKELLDELETYELVNNGETVSQEDVGDWEQEIEDLLELEDETT